MCIFRPALAIRFHSAAFQSVTNAGACRSCRLLRMLAGWAPMGGGAVSGCCGAASSREASSSSREASSSSREASSSREEAALYSAAAAVKQHNQGWFRCFVFAFDC